MIAELSPHPAPPTISTGVSITFIAPISSLTTVLPVALIRYLCLIPDHLVNYGLVRYPAPPTESARHRPAPSTDRNTREPNEASGPSPPTSGTWCVQTTRP